MTIVTLTTDFGHKDYSVSVIKAALLQQIPNLSVIDISHQISPYNPSETAYILKNAFRAFPEGTIHIIGVESEWTPENIHLAIEFEGHFFIGADNGILSMIIDDLKTTKIVEINIHDRIESSFPVLDVFVQVACFISRGGNLTVIGKETSSFKEMTEIQPKVSQDQKIITGGIIYIDNYGNIISNINKKLFVEIGKGRNFKISAAKYTFTKIVNKYNEVLGENSSDTRQFDGSKLALFNSAGYLEIAIYRSNLNTVGGASTLLGLGYRDTITIEFN